MEGKRIGVHQYHNITPTSTLETLNQEVLSLKSDLLGQPQISSPEESGSTEELGQELFLRPGAG